MQQRIECGRCASVSVGRPVLLSSLLCIVAVAGLCEGEVLESLSTSVENCCKKSALLTGKRENEGFGTWNWEVDFVRIEGLSTTPLSIDSPCDEHRPSIVSRRDRHTIEHFIDILLHSDAGTRVAGESATCTVGLGSGVRSLQQNSASSSEDEGQAYDNDSISSSSSWH